MTRLIELLQVLIERGADELLLSSGHFPQLRIGRRLTPLRTERSTVDSVLEGLKHICSDQDWVRFLSTGEHQCSFSLADIGRFRVMLFLHTEGVAAFFRSIPAFIPKLAQLGALSRAREVLSISRGMILVTGAASSGRSTIVASLLNELAATQNRFTATLERSIEFQIQAGSGIVSQRVAPQDAGEKAAMIRQCIADQVDVLFIEQIDDERVLHAAMDAIRSEILVITIANERDTQSVFEWLSRMLSPEPSSFHWRELASMVSAVISQQLLPRVGGGVAVANEIYMARPHLVECIRVGDFERMNSAWAAVRDGSLLRMDQCLLELVGANTVLEAEAYEVCIDRASFRGYMKNPPLDT